MPFVADRAKIICRAGLGVVGLVLLAAITGFTYNDLSVRHYRRLHPAPGRLYSVDG